jgi:hypothetical protein
MKTEIWLRRFGYGLLVFILVVAVFSGWTNYRDLYTGYSIRRLEDDEITAALDKILTDTMFIDKGLSFSTSVTNIAQTDAGAEVAFVDADYPDFSGTASLTKGPLGRYRVTSIEARLSADEGLTRYGGDANSFWKWLAFELIRMVIFVPSIYWLMIAKPKRDRREA